jgi:hypothetical protein
VNWLLSPSARSLAFVAVALLIGVVCYLVPLLFYVLLGVFAFVIIWLTLMRLTDRQDPDFRLDAKRTRELFEAEALNTSVHNHLAITAIVKPGPMRLLTLKFVLGLIKLLTHGVGKSDIGIHFAQWTVVPDRKCDVLLFLSNYDGGWAPYLDLLIDRGHYGINAIWSNALHFPRTRFLLFGGARDSRRLKESIRAYQHAASYRYIAYPDLPVRNIDNNSQIRNKISKKLSTYETNEWLLRF